MIISDRMMYARILLGLNSNEVVERSNIKRFQIVAAEYGLKEPHPETLKYYSKNGISNNWLINGKGPKTVKKPLSKDAA